ncbi:hypothetical protein, variant [Aphanomyces astaci]|uniref:Nudix hydrolase domain-containing protein n=1 Tax=Aphanomyces astaci TaxID=112090 RepID=W4H2V0_APHAT|nr:hypothetical protein, variant [Aphanomyces astaci]ETV86202.1 hypothetical protein, variant [Aphanomyces astaci]|eukprot:XP_009824674.1 hypothetical protein, variant [Aphanomyces astaci]
MILTAEKLKITMVQQSARRPTRHILHGTRTASVAAIFACPSTKATDPLELLFIRRAINPRDRWSGHIAFPGGRVEAGESALDAARRETMEEVGVDLTHAEVLGQLDDRLAARNGLVVHTFVFLLATKPSTCVLQPLEVSDVLWVSSLALADAPLRTLFYPIGPYLQRAVPRCLHVHTSHVGCNVDDCKPVCTAHLGEPAIRVSDVSMPVPPAPVHRCRSHRSSSP